MIATFGYFNMKLLADVQFGRSGYRDKSISATARHWSTAWKFRSRVIQGRGAVQNQVGLITKLD